MLIPAIWFFTLANATVALGGLFLAIFWENVFERTVEGGQDALPLIAKYYINHEQFIFAVFTVPLTLIALVVTFRRSITTEGTLLFGAATLFLTSMQFLLAILALHQPYITGITRFNG